MSQELAPLKALQPRHESAKMKNMKVSGTTFSGVLGHGLGF